MSGVDVFVAIVIWGLLALAVFQFLKQQFDNGKSYLEEAEYSPKMNTNSWDQHLRRLNKYGVSKYRYKFFHVDEEGKVYYRSSKREIVYCHEI